MEITVNAIVKELENRGYIVDEQTCIKNGIEVLGLAVKKNEDDKVVPTIYPEDIIREADERGLAVSEVVECLIPVIEQRPSIDIDRFTDREYLLSHVRIGVHEFVLLPSSIHECILVPHTRESDLEMFENMVKEVNATTVDPLERLVDRAYLLTA